MLLAALKLNPLQIGRGGLHIWGLMQATNTLFYISYLHLATEHNIFARYAGTLHICTLCWNITHLHVMPEHYIFVDNHGTFHISHNEGTLHMRRNDGTLHNLQIITEQFMFAHYDGTLHEQERMCMWMDMDVDMDMGMDMEMTMDMAV